MFSKDSNRKEDRRTRIPSIISASLHIVGDLVSEGDVQVEGIVEGDVHAKLLTISEGAVVKGGILAQSACIRGTVEGRITADQVELGRTARVVGDIVHSDLAVEAGAFFEGHCRHGKAEEEGQRRKAEGVDRVPPQPVAASASV